MSSVVYCIHHKEGCKWSGELRKLKVCVMHLQQLYYTFLRDYLLEKNVTVILLSNSTEHKSIVFNFTLITANLAQFNFSNSNLNPVSIVQPLFTRCHHWYISKFLNQIQILFQGHLNTCKHDAIACSNKCGAQIPRVLMEDHLKYTCSNRRTKCEFCIKEFTGQQLEVSVKNPIKSNNY